MADYHFERDCRTPHSESYTILEDDNVIGRVELHYAATVVHSTLCVIESLTQEQIHDLIDAIDEYLVDAVGVNREEFIVHVFQGRDAGVFSDHDFGQDGDEEAM